MNSMNATAVIYLRVSSADQVENTSLETQESVCRAWCRAHGYETPLVFSDRGESAKTADRPQFLAMVEFCRKNKPAVALAYRIDRWARNITDFTAFRSRLASYGVQMLSATENMADDPAGNAMSSILAVWAQYDNDTRSMRARDGMRATVRRGGYVTLAPRGYRNVRQNGLPTLEIVEPEAETVRDAIRSVVNSTYDPVQAAKALGCPPNHVPEMIRRPVWAGLSRCDGELVPGSWTPLVPRELWEQAVERLKRPARKECPDAFPLRGIVSCSCGRALTASSSTARNGAKHPYYHCHGCKARHRKADLEKQVDDWIRFQTLQTSPALRKVAQSVAAYARQAEEKLSARREKALRSAAALDAQIHRLQDFALKGLVPEDEFAAKNAQLRQNRAAAMEEAAAGDAAATTAAAVIDAAIALLNDVPKILLYATPAIRKALFGVLCGSTVVVERDGTCRTSKIPSVFSLLLPNPTPENEVAYLRGVEPLTF
jgi:site-specific DNA recombinase